MEVVDLDLELEAAKAKVTVENPIERSQQFKESVKQAMKAAKRSEVRSLFKFKKYESIRLLVLRTPTLTTTVRVTKMKTMTWMMTREIPLLTLGVLQMKRNIKKIWREAFKL